MKEMKIEALIGNRLRDVSRAVVKEIEVSKNIEPENFIIVPDRFSLIAEKMVFDELGISSTFNIQVVGISKLAKMVLEKQKEEIKLINNKMSELLVFQLIKENEKQFETLKHINFALAGEITKIIAQLKSCAITPQQFLESLDADNKKYLDIAKIFEAYQKKVETLGLDSSDLLDAFCKNADKSELIKNSNFFFVEFDSLTEQGYKILKELTKNAKKVVVGVLAPSNQKNSYIFDGDVLSKLNRLSKEENIHFTRKYIKSESLSITQNHLLNNLYSLSPVKENIHKISLLEFSTPEDEWGVLAKIILFQIRTESKRFKDFNILTPNLDDKKVLIERIFKEYGINYFIDYGVKFAETMPYDFFTAFFDYIKNPNTKNLCRLMAQPLCEVPCEDIFIFENLTDKLGKWADCLWIAENTEVPETIKDFVLKMSKYNNISDMTSSEKVVEQILQLMSQLDVENKIQKLTEKFVTEGNLKQQKIYQQLFKKTVDLLDMLSTANAIKSLAEFVEIFNKFAQELELSTVPLSVDSVFIGDSEKSFFEERKVLLVAGAEQNALPAVLKDYSIMSDNDIDVFADRILISPTVRMINKRNKFKLYQNLTMARENLVVSFSSDVLGDKKNGSNLFDELKKIFNKNGKKLSVTHKFSDYIAEQKFEGIEKFDIQTKKDFDVKIAELIQNGLKNQDFKKILYLVDFIDEKCKEYIKNCPDDILVKDAIKTYLTEVVEGIVNSRAVLVKNGHISASQIERFYQCPFKHFFSYGLKLKENEICKFDGRDIGNYFHKIAQEFIQKNAKQLSTLSDEQIKNELDKILADVYGDSRFALLKSCLDNKHMVVKLKNEAMSFAKKLAYEQKWSNFVAKLFEKYFDIKIDEETGLIGFVDRVDVCEDSYRIVDYKSGQIKQSLSAVYGGLELQLFIYLLAMKEQLGLNPAGAFYFPIGGDYSDNKTKRMVLSGFVVNDQSILKNMDRRFSGQVVSDIVNLKLNKNGLCATKKNVLTPEGIDAIMQYVKILAKKALDTMCTGRIIASPCEGACANCSLYGICSFQGEGRMRERKKHAELQGKDFIDLMKK